MSPSQFHDKDPHRREINGARPTPLKINKDSHLLQKQTVSATSSIAIAAAVSKQLDHQKQRIQQRHPVIIYTHSPKIIRTEARDFMALVQKLTGLTRSHDDEPPEPGPADTGPSRVVAGSDDGASSSVVTDENSAVTNTSVSPGFDPPQINPFFHDAPLFTPTGSDFFCSPQSIYRCPDPMFNSPSIGSAFSPSVMEVLKAYREY
ncbi:hypothetical protein H6P81_008889 [Aristolochia fimbriata]|uniref:VQ domain-containing protein n=1 Tax=Aristolochia fimbriata TaxID=158543 RepID=A0AAV7EJZ9_ARIFI|nr:hypothetical protein H6P81_008889 [Aristolochia fimbriata]